MQRQITCKSAKTVAVKAEVSGPCTYWTKLQRPWNYHNINSREVSSSDNLKNKIVYFFRKQFNRISFFKYVLCRSLEECITCRDNGTLLYRPYHIRLDGIF